jgi:hypothetical protein
VADGTDVHLTALAPKSWPVDCAKDANDCSIMLRIDYCSSSVLFTGAGSNPEKSEVALKPVTLLQVGHHGSETATGDDFIRAGKPRYAVISAGKKGEGLNRTCCHPRKEIVHRLNTALGDMETLAPSGRASPAGACERRLDRAPGTGRVMRPEGGATIGHAGGARRWELRPLRSTAA